MADKTKIIDWFITNSVDLKLKTTHYQWPEQNNFHIYDIGSTIEIENKRFFGRSLDLDPKDAILKSLTESYERYIYSSYQNIFRENYGIACHSSFDLACKNAKSELLERTILLNHFDSNSSGLFVSSNILDGELKKILSWITSLNIKIFFKKITSNQQNIIVCAANGIESKNKFGWLFGFSNEQDIKVAMTKSFFELLMNLSWTILNYKQEKYLIDDFLNDTQSIHIRKLNFFLSPNNSDIYSNWIFNEYTIQSEIQSYLVTFQKLHPKHLQLKKIPLYTAKAVFTPSNLFTITSDISKRKFNEKFILYPII